MELILGIQYINKAEATVGQSLLSGQQAEATNSAQANNELRSTIKGAAIDANQANQGATQLNRDTQIAVPSNIQSSQACQMGTSSTPASTGNLAGSLAQSVAGSSMSKQNYVFNKGGPTNAAYLATLAAMKNSSLQASNSISGPNGTPLTSTTVSSAYTYDAIVTNPHPLPSLTAAEKATPAGVKYEALKKVERSAISLPEKALNQVALSNVPLYPLGKFLKKQVSDMAGTSTFTAAMDLVFNGKLPSTTQATTLSSNIASNSTNGQVSQNTVLYIMNMLRFGNPKMWQREAVSTDSGYLLRQIAETDALRLDVAYNRMVLQERIAAMEAQSYAQKVSKEYNAEATQLRTRAIASAT
jgi:hypothetical protein